jgi:hypothetical protein
MNQKGEITLLATLLMMGLLGIIILTSLELKKSYLHLEKRTHLFLCVKETKGELQSFMSFIGKVNWGIKNMNKIKLLLTIFPGLQAHSMNAEKMKEYLQKSQDLRVINYLRRLNQLLNKSCPIDPRMLLTPFKMQQTFLKRTHTGLVYLREKEWSYHFINQNYHLELKIKPQVWENLHPKIIYNSKERKVKASSL